MSDKLNEVKASEANDLMRPRFKCIADYPNNIYKVGNIIEQIGREYFNTEFFEAYHHLFKKLEWWEERKIEEMPKYVKGGNENISGVFKVSRWKTDSSLPLVFCEDGKRVFGIGQIEPASLTDYNNLLTPKKQV